MGSSVGQLQSNILLISRYCHRNVAHYSYILLSLVTSNILYYTDITFMKSKMHTKQTGVISALTLKQVYIISKHS